MRARKIKKAPWIVKAKSGEWVMALLRVDCGLLRSIQILMDHRNSPEKASPIFTEKRLMATLSLFFSECRRQKARRVSVMNWQVQRQLSHYAQCFFVLDCKMFS